MKNNTPMKCTLILVAILMLYPPSIKAQQNYTGDQTSSCNNDNKSKPFESSLYKCNGLQPSCKAFLVFTAKSPFNNVPMISSLTSSDHDELARANNATRFTVFSEDKQVIVPVNCSCSDRTYYRASTTYQISERGETYFKIADELFQGLSTCDSIKHSNTDHHESSLFRGLKLRVPLLCACPTKKQVKKDVNFLLTYTIASGDTVYALSKRFNVSLKRLKEANCFYEQDPMIYPRTTILIPLESEPSSSEITSCASCNRNRSSLQPIPVDPQMKSNRGHSKKKYKLLFLLFLLVLAVILPYLLCYYKKKLRMQEPVKGGNDPPRAIASRGDLILEIAKLDRPVKHFRFSEIKKATRNFRSKNRIEGCVYRGDFKRQVVAVKKRTSEQNAENEMKTLQHINHFNIVKLHGFSKHREELWLVYEYMKNGSLRKWLGGERPNDPNQLMSIALDVSNALLYLHSFTNPAYVHNNITSDNILLDGNLRGKIGNFSQARTANFASETKIVGDSEGYMAPEYFESCEITTKVDVFAFGVVLLEMVTGKEPVFVEDGEERLLITAVGDAMGSEDSDTEMSRMIEPRLCEIDGGFRFAVQIVGLSLSCLRQDPEDRPSMVEIVSALQKLQSNMKKTVHRSYIL